MKYKIKKEYEEMYYRTRVLLDDRWSSDQTRVFEQVWLAENGYFEEYPWSILHKKNISLLLDSTIRHQIRRSIQYKYHVLGDRIPDIFVTSINEKLTEYEFMGL